MVGETTRGTAKIKEPGDLAMTKSELGMAVEFLEDFFKPFTKMRLGITKGDLHLLCPATFEPFIYPGVFAEESLDIEEVAIDWAYHQEALFEGCKCGEGARRERIVSYYLIYLLNSDQQGLGDI